MHLLKKILSIYFYEVKLSSLTLLCKFFNVSEKNNQFLSFAYNRYIKLNCITAN